jgi:hypothetical protein
MYPLQRKVANCSKCFIPIHVHREVKKEPLTAFFFFFFWGGGKSIKNGTKWGGRWGITPGPHIKSTLGTCIIVPYALVKLLCKYISFVYLVWHRCWFLIPQLVNGSLPSCPNARKSLLEGLNQMIGKIIIHLLALKGRQIPHNYLLCLGIMIPRCSIVRETRPQFNSGSRRICVFKALVANMDDATNSFRVVTCFQHVHVSQVLKNLTEK